MKTPTIAFVEWPKIARFSREIIVTEKIDGTNAQIYIPEAGDADAGEIYAGSRTKWITPQDDNAGFAGWVERNKEELLQLGPGNHFGEWWGKGIQRGYGVPDKRFSLFNVHRWADDGKDKRPACCSVVPTLYRGEFSEAAIYIALDRLKVNGSLAAPCFMKPEGIVIYHVAANMSFKKTLEKDEQPKGTNR